MDQKKLRKMLVFEEGYDDQPYECSEGHTTGGIGHKMTDEEYEKHKRGIPEGVIEAWYFLDVLKAEKAAKSYPWFGKLSEPRQAVIISMIFQLGEAGFRKFKKAIKAIDRGDISTACDEFYDSLWRMQTPNRAKRQINQFATGEWAMEYKING